MPITFSCEFCGKQLRAPDGSEGKKTRCPQCGAALAIPGEEVGYEVAEEAPPPRPKAARAMRQCDNCGEMIPASASVCRYCGENPYGAPMDDAELEEAPRRRRKRSGPPWERDGASVNSFFATVKGGLFGPSELFSKMRRDGGYSMPLMFMIIGFTCSMLVSFAYGLISNAIWADQRGNAPPNPAAAGGVAMAMVCMLVLAPIIAVIVSLVYSGLHHLGLAIVGGAQHGFETTFRVYCYAMGSVTWLNLIPFSLLPFPPVQFGMLAMFGVWMIVATTIGLRDAHEVPTWKGLIGALTPAAVGCMVGILIAVAFGAAFAAMMQRGGQPGFGP
jgi:hypothetical protein